jgi:acyl-CoA thioesterase-1
VSILSKFSLASLCLAVTLLPGVGAATTGSSILVLGDSLSAAYGIRLEQGWVALLGARLKQEGYGHRVVNASSSGETTGGALARLPRALERHRPAVVVIELGGNDGLRGLPVAEVRDNLDQLIRLSRASGAEVLLVGMRIPPNYGPTYTREFQALFGELAKKHRLPLVPFFLEGIALDDSLMQEDGIHPNAAAQPRLLAQVWPRLEPLLAHDAVKVSGTGAQR